MDFGDTRSVFRKNLRGKILRLMNHHHRTHITWEEVEEVGRRSKMQPGEASGEFLRLRGLVWNGTISRSSESEHPWDTIQLDVPWFQQRGDVPLP
jgi:hypothetical protein